MSTGLQLREGVLLAHALVAHVSRQLGVRSFFIKGPLSVLQGLRAPKQSSDVDVFVSASDVELLTGALRARGWLTRSSDPDELAFPQHSVTLFHPNWPNDIDVHYRFPGMERKGPECFEAMWAATDEMELAGQPLRVPTVPLAVCFLALHSLRAPWLAGSKRDLEFLGQLDLSRFRSEIFALALATDATAAMRPFLEYHFGPLARDIPGATSDEWNRRLASRSPGTARILAILAAPPSKKPLLTWRALFPPKQGILAKDINADVSLKGRLRNGYQRWHALLSACSATTAEVYAFRREKHGQRN